MGILRFNDRKRFIKTVQDFNKALNSLEWFENYIEQRIMMDGELSEVDRLNNVLITQLTDDLKKEVNKKIIAIKSITGVEVENVYENGGE